MGGRSTTIQEEGQSNLGGGEVVLHPGGHPHPPHQLLHAAAHLEGKSKLDVKIKGLLLYRNVTLLHGDDDALRVDEEGGAEGDVLLRLVDAILSGHHASWVGGEPHLQLV